MAKKYQFHNEFSKYPTSAIQAKAMGEMYFFTGKPCSKGHISLKYASSGNCLKCIEKRRGTVEINFRGKSSKRNQENQKRAEYAISKGETTYIPDSPCKHGHLNRYVGTNNCVECANESAIKRRDYAKWLRIKKEYGMSKKEFYLMLNVQNKKCSICEYDLTEKNTHIDHCHKTKKVRSLLCSRCNQAIGLLDENICRMRKAIQYLEQYNAT